MHELQHLNDSTGEPGWELASTLQRFNVRRRALEDRATINMADMRILWLFKDGKPRAMRAIAEELGLEQSTVNRQVNAALDAGLLTRDRAPGVSSYRFGPTARGTALFESNLSATLAGYETALQALGTDKASQLLALFSEFVTAFEQIAAPEK